MLEAPPSPNRSRASGQTIEPNQELMGMALATWAAYAADPVLLVHALSGEFPKRGRFTDVGDVEQRSGSAHLLVAAPVFNYLPVAALAAHLMRVVIIDQPRPDPHRHRSTRSDAAVFLSLYWLRFSQIGYPIYAGIGCLVYS